MTIVVNNKDGLYTLITPFINDRDTVTALLFAYHTDGGTKTIYRLYNKDNYKKYFSYTGDKEAATINRTTVEGWLGLFSKTHQRLKSVQEGKTLPRTIYYEWECIRYTWTYGNEPDASTGFGMSDWQCTYKIIDKGRYDEVKDELTNEPDPIPGGSGGGGTAEVWTYTEIPANNQHIIDSLQGYPCAQEILAKMPNLNNFTQQYIQQIFGVGSNLNVIFFPDPGNKLPLGALGGTKRAESNEGKLYIDIYLNPLLLQSGTREMMLAVMLHESIHAFYEFQIAKYKQDIVDSNTFKANYPKIWQYYNEKNSPGQHLEMSNSIIDNICEALQVYNSSMSAATRRALANNGMYAIPYYWASLGANTTAIIDVWNKATYGDSTQAASLNLKKCMQQVTIDR
jgi:hypothetical protein